MQFGKWQNQEQKIRGGGLAGLFAGSKLNPAPRSNVRTCVRVSSIIANLDVVVTFEFAVHKLSDL